MLGLLIDLMLILRSLFFFSAEIFFRRSWSKLKALPSPFEITDCLFDKSEFLRATLTWSKPIR